MTELHVCTLYEGSYHYGVAALVNSLCAHGFTGVVYAGYRGELPRWAATADAESVVGWKSARRLKVTSDVSIVFLLLDTDYHLTNYKPDFMLNLLAGPASSAESMFYFDPDIIVNERWSYFTEWVSCGVALCEDVNSPLAKEHPRRVGWRRHFVKHQEVLTFKSEEYVNGGFVAIQKGQVAFLDKWRTLQLLISEVTGGLSAAKIFGGIPLASKGFANCFDSTDQDALNAAIECCDQTCSIVGREAMGFKAGASVLPHALGSGKPWARSFMLWLLKGYPPRLVDKLYWQHASTPLAAHSRFEVACKRLAIGIASFVGRFYSRR